MQNFVKTKSTTEKSDSTNPDGKEKKLVSPSFQNQAQLDAIFKQLNIVTPGTITSPYGNSDEALIASILRQQGIGPTTPKSLVDIYSQTTTTRKPRSTTSRPPGPLMQTLNWVLNALAPPTTRKPKPKPKSRKPKQQDELLTHQPTHITPVVTAAPYSQKNVIEQLSQEELQKLIKQLETIQKNPNSAQSADLSSVKSLLSLINTDKGVQVTSSSSFGTSQRPSTTTRTRSRVVKSTTPIALSVSNNIEDVEDEEFATTSTTSKPRISLPPVKLKPVPGIEDTDTLVRGNLITAAVNVTRAISSFLGTALQVY